SPRVTSSQLSPTFFACEQERRLATLSCRAELGLTSPLCVRANFQVHRFPRSFSMLRNWFKTVPPEFRIRGKQSRLKLKKPQLGVENLEERPLLNASNPFQDIVAAVRQPPIVGQAAAGAGHSAAYSAAQSAHTSANASQQSYDLTTVRGVQGALTAL